MCFTKDKDGNDDDDDYYIYQETDELKQLRASSFSWFV